MKNPIISVSGLRGILGESLSPVVAMQYVTAFSSILRPGAVLITRDGRSSGKMLADAIQAALLAVGRNVIYADVAATPTTGVLVRDLQAAGGIQISASHNPVEYNGIKLFGEEGRVLGDVAGQQVMDAMQREPDWVAQQFIGQPSVIADTTSQHLDLVLDTVDVEVIRSHNYKVVLDSNHGAGSLLGRRMLLDLNTNLVLLGGTADGQFEHAAEPTADNLEGVARYAASLQPDIVFCQDPDADRLAIIDESGRYIGEEYTLALTLQRRLMQQTGDCVINCATSRMSIDIAEQLGCQCHLSAVGEANVCDLMQSVGAIYGGEGNGGPIDPRVGYVRDSFVAMAQVLELMAITGKPVSALVDALPRYSIRKAKSDVDRGKLPEIYNALKREYADAKVSDMDGIRFDWADRWLLIRPSNTEPIVRLIAEAANDERSQQLIDSATNIVEQV